MLKEWGHVPVEKKGQTGTPHSSPQVALPRNCKGKPDSCVFFTSGNKEDLKLEGRSSYSQYQFYEASRKTHAVSGSLNPGNQTLGYLRDVSSGSETQGGQN